MKEIASFAGAPLVSCLCVTQGRVLLLQRAVACFRKQTYAPRELVVLCQDDDQATLDYVATLSDSNIRAIKVPCSPRLNIGQLRNRSIDEARGHYIAIWDDDDWYDKTRLSEQIRAIQQTGRSGCVLSSLVLYDEQTQSAFLSHQRSWEGSLVAERAVMPAFKDIARGEDTPVVVSLLKDNRLTALERPELYIYVFHGNNTWGPAHWNSNLLRYAQRLSPIHSAEINDILKRALA